MNYSRRNIARISRRLNSRSAKRGNKILLAMLTLLIVGMIGGAAVGFSLGLGAFKGIIDTAPDISNINVTPSGFSTFVYDSQGNQTAKLVSTDSNRIPVTMDMVPKNLQHAFVAIEDERFYDHHGIDIQGIIRAGFLGLKSGHFSQGASTITQQLIKNNVFTGWTDETFSESVRRKIQEQYLAVELEKNMSKDEILLNYLNTINLGHNTLGVQAASLRYFGKSVNQLNLSECATIAGITQNPTKYDPIVYPENNDAKRKKVLESMEKLGFISKQECEEAIADNVYSRIQLVDNETEDETINSYFVDALTEQVLDDLIAKGYTENQAYTLLYSGGLSIFSTQDPAIQKIVDEEVANDAHYPNGTRWYLNYKFSVQSTDGEIRNYSTEMLSNYFKERNPYFTLIFNTQEDARAKVEEYKAAVMEEGDTIIAESENLTPQPQISLTIEDQRTGHVLAMSGGRGEKKANRTLNRATGVVRQPGSTFKVVSTYAPALDAAGMTLATTQNDAPYTYADGTPVRNWYGEAYRGRSSIRQGIQNSMNIVTVKTLVDITPRLGYDYLLDFGFTTLVESEEINGKIFSDIQPTLALGGLTHGVKNIELNASYATIANQGVYIEPKLYSKITDHDGNVILDSSDRQERRVLKETTAWLLTSAMKDVVTKGTGTAVNFGTTPIAGKTGTTSDENDVWFAGYTDYYTCTTWAGYDENTDLVGNESSIAKRLWRAVMERVHEGLSSRDFTKPNGIVQEQVCSLSGKKPVQGLCSGSLTTEFFARESLPAESCDVHFQGLICALDGKPATDDCPFKVSGVVTLEEKTDKCHHTYEFMIQAGISDIIAQENEKLQIMQAQAAAAANAGNVLAAANATLQVATDTLNAARDQLVAAQQSGDQAVIAQVQETLRIAETNYNAAVQQQAAAAAAEQAVREAQQ